MLQDPLTQTLLDREQPKETAEGIWPIQKKKPMGKKNPTGPTGPTGRTPTVRPPQATPSSGQPVPPTPPNPKNRIPPAVDRYVTGQKMIQAYQNNWTPNPILLRILEGS